MISPRDAEKINEFNAFIRPYGLSVNARTDNGSSIRPKMLRDVIDKVKGTPNERVISMTMLRSLMKAKYSEENIGHFGLAAKYYCHLTSPIRRYPDLVVHRILKAIPPPCRSRRATAR